MRKVEKRTCSGLLRSVNRDAGLVPLRLALLPALSLARFHQIQSLLKNDPESIDISI